MSWPHSRGRSPSPFRRQRKDAMRPDIKRDEPRSRGADGIRPILTNVGANLRPLLPKPRRVFSKANTKNMPAKAEMAGFPPLPPELRRNFAGIQPERGRNIPP